MPERSPEAEQRFLRKQERRAKQRVANIGRAEKMHQARLEDIPVSRSNPVKLGSDTELAVWAKRIHDCKPKHAWIYFNNDRDGYAIKNAKKLLQMLKAAT